MNSKILITGSSGFIFSNYVRFAIYEKKYPMIVGVDKISNSAALNSLYQNKGNINYIADITDEHIFNRIVEYEQPDLIIHAAALTSVDEALVSPNDYIYNNVIGTNIVAKIAAKYKIRLLYVSTDEVYGHLETENDPSWTEESPIKPRNLYSASKASGEHIVRSYGNSEGLNYNIIRMSNNYGPRQTTNKLIPRSIKSLLNNEKIKIYDKGQHIRDWLNVRDTYSAINTVIEKGYKNETYNIGANQEFSNIEVAQLICKAMNKVLEIEFIEDRKGHDHRYSLNSDKLKKLGWKPSIKFKEGIENVVQWYLVNKYWIR